MWILTILHMKFKSSVTMMKVNLNSETGLYLMNSMSQQQPSCLLQYKSIGVSKTTVLYNTGFLKLLLFFITSSTYLQNGLNIWFQLNCNHLNFMLK